MDNDRVNASPTDVRKLAASLVRYKKDVADASVRVRGALRAANWHDTRKTQFESSYQDLQNRVDRFLSSEVDEMVRRLNDLARRLDDIQQVRM